MNNNFLEDGRGFRLGLDAIRSAKRREFERFHCPIMSKTIDKETCEGHKKNNKLSCQMCEKLIAIRKEYINNLIAHRKGQKYTDTDDVRFI